MSKTAKQIQGDVWRMLLGSELAEMISGGVYRNGFRPRDSRLEDATVTFTAGLPDQIESGVVTVNIYVPDIEDADGTLIEDGARTALLEEEAQRWADSLTAARSGYLFSLRQTAATFAEPSTGQHFVSLRLGYRLFEG